MSDAPDWQRIVRTVSATGDMTDAPDWERVVVGPGGTPLGGGLSVAGSISSQRSSAGPGWRTTETTGTGVVVDYNGDAVSIALANAADTVLYTAMWLGTCYGVTTAPNLGLAWYHHNGTWGGMWYTVSTTLMDWPIVAPTLVMFDSAVGANDTLTLHAWTDAGSLLYMGAAGAGDGTDWAGARAIVLASS